MQFNSRRETGCFEMCKACPAMGSAHEAMEAGGTFLQDAWKEEAAEVGPTVATKAVLTAPGSRRGQQGEQPSNGTSLCSNRGNGRYIVESTPAVSSTPRWAEPIPTPVENGPLPAPGSGNGNGNGTSESAPEPSSAEQAVQPGVSEYGRAPESDNMCAGAKPGLDMDVGTMNLCPPHYQGKCGFVVRLKQDTPAGPWMCHHFTIDGIHCARSGLGPEHANRCAGLLAVIDPEADEVTVCMGLRKPAESPSTPLLARCNRPSSGPVCRVDTCPFLASNLACPYATGSRSARAVPNGGCDNSGAEARLLQPPNPDDDVSPYCAAPERSASAATAPLGSQREGSDGM
eukprot:gnl/TRDRNA2_/TRDRNA2_42196_c0_seq1.p1 gnl/TRDRNA2_/TRDRNA2_42196_c0~~gnl/TRDRNA2_/TRDRNA2_42196_c0_seq1.p1  ORF type:complete len:344 (-),score=35.58 gnl/TRDRNA2_/TRDRNA2_42196_c0_seq1:149-1180(-)